MKVYLLSFVLLLSCVAPIYGMENNSPEKEPWYVDKEIEASYCNGGFFIPTVEGIGMSAVVSVLQAMRYNNSFNASLKYGVLGGMVAGMYGLGLTGMLINDECPCPGPDRTIWYMLKKPANIVSATVLTCLSLCLVNAGLAEQIAHKCLDS